MLVLVQTASSLALSCSSHQQVGKILCFTADGQGGPEATLTPAVPADYLVLAGAGDEMLSDSFEVKEQEFFYEVQGQASRHLHWLAMEQVQPDITQHHHEHASRFLGGPLLLRSMPPSTGVGGGDTPCLQWQSVCPFVPPPVSVYGPVDPCCLCSCLQWQTIGDVDVDIGANPSAEDAEEGQDSSARKVIDIIESFRLVVSSSGGWY